MCLWLQCAVSESAKRLEQSRKAMDKPERCNEFASQPIDLQLAPSPRQACSAFVRVPKHKSTPTSMLQLKLESMPSSPKVDTEEKTTRIRWDEEESHRLLQLLGEPEKQHQVTIRTRKFMSTV